MKICELHCEQCDIPVCVLCISPQKHQFHDVTDISDTLKRTKNNLKKDLEELEKYVYQKYQEIAASISDWVKTISNSASGVESGTGG